MTFFHPLKSSHNQMFFQVVLELKKPEPSRKPLLAGKPESAPNVLETFPERTTSVVMETEKVPEGPKKVPQKLQEKSKKHSEDLQRVMEKPKVPQTLPKEQKKVQENLMKVPVDKAKEVPEVTKRVPNAIVEDTEKSKKVPQHQKREPKEVTDTPRKVQEAPEKTLGSPEKAEETQIQHKRVSEAPKQLRKSLEEPQLGSQPLEETPSPVLHPETHQQKGSLASFNILWSNVKFSL